VYKSERTYHGEEDEALQAPQIATHRKTELIDKCKTKTNYTLVSHPVCCVSHPVSFLATPLSPRLFYLPTCKKNKPKEGWGKKKKLKKIKKKKEKPREPNALRHDFPRTR